MPGASHLCGIPLNHAQELHAHVQSKMVQTPRAADRTIPAGPTGAVLKAPGPWRSRWNVSSVYLGTVTTSVLAYIHNKHVYMHIYIYIYICICIYIYICIYIIFLSLFIYLFIVYMYSHPLHPQIDGKVKSH